MRRLFAICFTVHHKPPLIGEISPCGADPIIGVALLLTVVIMKLSSKCDCNAKCSAKLQNYLYITYFLQKKI